MSADLAIDIEIPPRGSRTRMRDIHRQLRQAIVEERLKPGARLPSTRAFAAEYGVARNTVAAIYELLLAEGYITARPGSGVYVARAAPAPPARKQGEGALIDPELRERAARLV
ncbi:MAG: winged helix-turn-helix domain-containing protein, partial [Maricaulaceae bacterium]